MQTRIFVPLFLIAVLWGGLARHALADPCGMVPPIYTGDQVPLARVGIQQTYVFYKDGVETFVIRPGFTGKVDQFGMLIPFPSVPAIRKVPDHIFPHIAAAVDPPEVVVDLRLRLLKRKAAVRFRGRNKDSKGLEFAKEEVRVIKKEAVGMYEVAVLAAGSAKALQRWMDDHGYKYPKGMDDACEDDVNEGWCFVAVKTRVGQKDGVDPQPGQRAVNSKLPLGSTFDGHVQGMGFRFEVDQLVVPMRLSSYNDGELRNVVYLLTDGPQKIRSIPEEYVVRQVSGEQLTKNMTGLLPLRIIGGSEADIPEYMRRDLPKRRDPVPKNGAARELFASDLQSARSGELALPHEEREKELLRIGERVGLRGGDIDKLNNASLADERRKTTVGSLDALKGMTLTVVDGDFPRELLRNQNLTFVEYKMPTKRNSPGAYDAKLNGPAPKQAGILKFGALSPVDQKEIIVTKPKTQSNAFFRLAWLIPTLAIALAGLGLAVRSRRLRGASAATLFFLILAAALAPLAVAQETKDEAKKPAIRDLLRDLSDSDKAEAAVAALVKRGDEAKEQLKGEALEGNNLSRRGWAIIALSEIGGKDVDEHLRKVHEDNKQPALVRTWAAAARVYMTEGTDELIAKAPLIQQFPALGRPLGMRIVAALSEGKEPASAEGLLTVSLKVPTITQALVPSILALGSDKLTVAMATAKDQNVRRQAAAYLGALVNQGDKNVGPAVVKKYKFDPMAKAVPWDGGPLFVPGSQWTKDDARALVGNLIAWHLWADLKKRADLQKQIHNNIRSNGLAGNGQYPLPGFQERSTVQWLEFWGKVVGREQIEKILKDQNVNDNAKYSGVLEKL